MKQLKTTVLALSCFALISLGGCSSTSSLTSNSSTDATALSITGVVQATNTNFNDVASLPTKINNFYVWAMGHLHGINAASQSDLKNLPNCPVTLYTINNQSNPLATTVTDNDGRYSFPAQTNNRVYVVKAEKTKNGKTITMHNIAHGDGVQETPIDPETTVAFKHMEERNEVDDLLKHYSHDQETAIEKVDHDIKQIVHNHYAIPANPYPDCTNPIIVPTPVVTDVANLAYTLTVTVAGGTVAQSPVPTAGKYLIGTVVTLTPTPLAGYVFSHWTGAVSGNAGVVTININSDKVVSAVFVSDIYVDDSNTSGIEDGSLAHPFNTIEEGVNFANNGCKVHVMAGNYSVGQSIQITKSMSIIGENPNSTVINSNIANYVFIVLTNDVSISSLQIINSTGGGIVAGQSNTYQTRNFTVRKCKIFTNGTGLNIWSADATGLKIYNNIISSVGDGLGLQMGAVAPINYEIVNNTIRGLGNVSVVSNCSNVGTPKLFKNNIIFKNPTRGIWVFGSSTSPVMSYNDFWANLNNYVGNAVQPPTDISLDPMFVDGKYSATTAVDMSQGNYHLQSGSPCINAGDPAILYNDTDGSRNDIGAYGGADPIL